MDDQILQDLRQAAAGGKPASGDPVLDDLRSAVANPGQPDAVSQIPEPAATAPWWQKAAQNVGMGALSGASKIGATLLAPVQQAVLAQAREDREAAGGPSAAGGPTGEQADPLRQTPTTRADLQKFFAEKADPNSLAFKGGELGAEVAGTAGAGGILGAGAKALGASPAVVSALGSGGLSLGGQTAPLAANLALRTGAGAAVGATSAGLINPDDAAAGAAIGAATPGAAWLAGVMGRGLMKAVGTVAKTGLGMSTGAGGGAIDAAYQAGKAGDTSFLENMRGDATMADVVEQAKDALGQMRAARGQAYRQGMAAVSGDKTVLDMGPIQQALSNAPSGMFNGKVVNEDVVAATQKIRDKVSEWASADPSVFHTPEGFDQLKQAIGGIREATQPGTAARTAADQVYHAVKGEIVNQAPVYAQVMGDYETASTQLSEIQRSLSLGNKASADTALRKLQSVLRNNVNTNFGNRLTSVQALEQQGGASIVPALAGQALSSAAPRGITGPIEAGVGGVAALAGHPAALAAAPFTSPRLVGEATYKAGQLAGKMSALTPRMGNLAPILANPNIPLTVQDYFNKVRPVQAP